MERSPNLDLPYIMPSQAQKHVTHNEAIRALDAVVQLSVETQSITVPPSAPADGARYIIGFGAQDDWVGHDGQLAAFQDGAWAYFVPEDGWLAWVKDIAGLVVYREGSWLPLQSGSAELALQMGINAQADGDNRLTVKSDNVLFTHDDVTPGSGDMRHKLNKATPAHTASLLFQTDFQGRAEIGTTGSDAFSIKISPDGESWREAMIVEGANGRVSFPHTSFEVNTNLLINGDFAINQRRFTGGALAAGAYGVDRWKAGPNGATVTIENGLVSLANGQLCQVVEQALWRGRPFGGSDFTISLESPTADVEVAAGGAPTLISAGMGRRSGRVSVPQGHDTDLVVTIQAAGGGAVSFADVKLEFGERATPWQPRPESVEYAMAQRYCLQLAGTQNGDRFAIGFRSSSSSGRFSFSFSHPAAFRAPPLVSHRDLNIRLLKIDGALGAFDVNNALLSWTNGLLTGFELEYGAPIDDQMGQMRFKDADSYLRFDAEL